MVGTKPSVYIDWQKQEFRPWLVPCNDFSPDVKRVVPVCKTCRVIMIIFSILTSGGIPLVECISNYGYILPVVRQEEFVCQ